MQKRKDIIILFGTHNWGWVKRRPEHIAVELSKKGCRVLFVETPFDFDFGNINLWKMFGRSNREIFTERARKGRVVKISQNLWVYKTPFVLPQKLFPVRALNIFLMKIFIKKLLKKLNFSSPILWLGDYRGVDFIGSFGESLVCWDSVDEETEFTDNRDEKEDIHSKVVLLSQRVNCIFATSRRLYERKKVLNKNTYFVPNAVDFDWYLSNESDRLEVPDELKKVKKPILGYVGYLDKWVDIELIKYLAFHNPLWQIVLIGPSRVNTAGLRVLDNVHLIERKDYREMPRYVRHFDVALVPFKINKLTNAVNPLKVYEYLALGKPVVATDFEEIRYFKDVVCVAETKEDFAAILDKIIREGCLSDDQTRKMRKSFAEKNTWSNRVDEILLLFNKWDTDSIGENAHR